MEKYRVVITGASGLLGRAVMEEFGKTPNKWDMTGFAFTRTGEKYLRVDLRNKNEIKEVLCRLKPHVIVHCAAERRPNAIEHQEDQARQLNVEATSYLANCAKELGSYLLYISTDYVFDGTKAPYYPGDKPNPLNKYGETKRDGENAVLEYQSNVAVLRVPILYGNVEHLGESAVTCLFEVVKKKSEAEVSDFEIRQPTAVNDIASVCRQMCEKQLQTEGTCDGIFHWGSDSKLTKYQMVKIMGELFGLPIDHIVAFKEPSTGAKRPYNCYLDCSRLKNLGIEANTDFREGIKKCLESFL